jgi:hypothetical protein
MHIHTRTGRGRRSSSIVVDDDDDDGGAAAAAAGASMNGLGGQRVELERARVARAIDLVQDAHQNLQCRATQDSPAARAVVCSGLERERVAHQIEPR